MSVDEVGKQGAEGVCGLRMARPTAADQERQDGRLRGGRPFAISAGEPEDVPPGSAKGRDWPSFGMTWSTAPWVRSGNATPTPRRRSLSNACGEVTSSRPDSEIGLIEEGPYVWHGTGNVHGRWGVGVGAPAVRVLTWGAANGQHALRKCDPGYRDRGAHRRGGTGIASGRVRARHQANVLGRLTGWAPWKYDG